MPRIGAMSPTETTCLRVEYERNDHLCCAIWPAKAPCRSFRRACDTPPCALLSQMAATLLFAYPIGQRSCGSGVRLYTASPCWVELHNSGKDIERIQFFLPRAALRFYTRQRSRPCKYHSSSKSDGSNEKMYSPVQWPMWCRIQPGRRMEKAIVGTIFDKADDSIGAVIRLIRTGARGRYPRRHNNANHVSWLPDGTPCQ